MTNSCKPVPIITPEVECRYWSKIDKTPGFGPKGECWRWSGALSPDGYPKRMMVSGVYYRVGQIALMIDGEYPRPDKDLALHSCDNPPCCNPAHLRWGSEADNIRDAAERGVGGRRGFTAEEVRYIRNSPLRHSEVAKEFGTSAACILNIRKRVTHRHVG